MPSPVATFRRGLRHSGKRDALAKKLRLDPGHRVAILNAPTGYFEHLAPAPADLHTELGVTDLPATPWWVKRDVLGEITAETGYKPVAFVKIDDHWTALRFKRS